MHHCFRPLGAALLLLALVVPGASADTVTRGSTLQLTPFPVNQGSDCDAYFALGGPVHNPFGATTCTYYQGFVFGNADTDTRTGFVPSDGVINTVTVKEGANPAPLKFVILRTLTPAKLTAQAGDPKCCFWVTETPAVQPAANTTTTFTVNLPVENNRTSNIITQDAIGFSSVTGGTLPLAFVPGQFSPSTFTPNGLTSNSFHPAVGPDSGVNSGGAFATGIQGGLDVLLQYTFTATAVPVTPATPVAPVTPVTPVTPITPVTPLLRPTDITTIGGSVLRPIGGALDVVLNCLQTTCGGTLNVLTRNPIAARAAATKSKKKIRSLGSKKFSLKKGKNRKVHVSLNTLGRQLAKQGTQITIVVDLGKAGKTQKNGTLTKASKKRH